MSAPSTTNATTESFSCDYLARLQGVLNQIDTKSLATAIDMIENAWIRGAQIITLGNGGSAQTALHFITDWNKSPFLSAGRPFRGRSLLDNIGLLTAYANDISYQDVFVEQLRNVVQADDLVIAISGSGNSENVIRAVRYAREKEIETLGLCGFSGGKLLQAAAHCLHVPVDDMQLVEDVHMLFGHIVMQKLCRAPRRTEK